MRMYKIVGLIKEERLHIAVALAGREGIVFLSTNLIADIPPTERILLGVLALKRRLTLVSAVRG